MTNLGRGCRKILCVGHNLREKMEVTKKEEQERENQEVKRPQIDPAIIEELMKGCSIVHRPPQSQSSMPSSKKRLLSDRETQV